MFGKYKRKPTVVEAVQWDGTIEMARALVNVIGSDLTFYENTKELLLQTHAGSLRILPNDWILKDTKGGYYPCKSDIFALTYQKEVEKPKLIK